PPAVVAEQVIGQGRGALGGTIPIDLLLLLPAEARVPGVPRQVVADVEVEVAVAVQVGERGRGRPIPVATPARRVGHVPERAVTLVAIEGVGAPAGDEEVGTAVVVIIADRNAVPVARREVRDAGRGGGIREGAVAPVSEEAVAAAGG